MLINLIIKKITSLCYIVCVLPTLNKTYLIWFDLIWFDTGLLPLATHYILLLPFATQIHSVTTIFNALHSVTTICNALHSVTTICNALHSVFTICITFGYYQLQRVYWNSQHYTDELQKIADNTLLWSAMS